MPKINRVRVVNFIYDNGYKFLEDEIFPFAGEQSLIKLANGGGKSTLIQLVAQTVIPNARIKDRTMAHYVIGNKRTSHVLTEWILDGTPTRYLLTGFTIYGSSEKAEYFSYIHSYSFANSYDIESIPITKIVNGKKHLVTYDELKVNLECLKGNVDYPVISFQTDNDSARSRYKNQLRSYSILPEEWETILKINSAEGGVEAYFEGQKRVRDVIEKSFLPAIEKIVVPEGEAAGTVAKALVQHIKSLVLLPQIEKQIQVHNNFSAGSQQWLAAATEYQGNKNELAGATERIAGVYLQSKQEQINLQIDIDNIEKELQLFSEQIDETHWQKDSYHYGLKQEEADLKKMELDEKTEERSKNTIEKDAKNDRLLRYKGAIYLSQLKENQGKQAAVSEQLELAGKEHEEIIARNNAYTNLLGELLQQRVAEQDTQLKQLNIDKQQASAAQKTAETTIEVGNSQMTELKIRENKLNQELVDVQKLEGEVRESLVITDLVFDVAKEFTSRQSKIEILTITNEKHNVDSSMVSNQIPLLKTSIKTTRNAVNELKIEQSKLQEKIETHKRELYDLEETYGKAYHFGRATIYNGQAILHLKAKVSEKNYFKDTLIEKKAIFDKQLELLQDAPFYLTQPEILTVIKTLQQNGCPDAIAGSEFLLQLNDPSAARAYIAKFPLLPYSILVAERSFTKQYPLISGQLVGSSPVILIFKETLALETMVNSSYYYQVDDGLGILLPTDTEIFVSKEALDNHKQNLFNQQREYKVNIESLKTDIKNIDSAVNRLEEFRRRFPLEQLRSDEQTEEDKAKEIISMDNALLQLEEEELSLLDRQEVLQGLVQDNKDSIRTIKQENSLLQQLITKQASMPQTHESLQKVVQEISQLDKTILAINQELKKQQANEKTLIKNIVHLTTKFEEQQALLIDVRTKYIVGIEPQLLSIVEQQADYQTVLHLWQEICNKVSGASSTLHNSKAELTALVEKYNQVNKLFIKIGIPAEELASVVIVSEEQLEDLEKDINVLIKEYHRLDKQHGGLEGEYKQLLRGAIELCDKIKANHNGREPYSFPSLNPYLLTQLEKRLHGIETSQSECNKRKSANSQLNITLIGLERELGKFIVNNKISTVGTVISKHQAKELSFVIDSLLREYDLLHKKMDETRTMVQTDFLTLVNQANQSELVYIKRCLATFNQEETSLESIYHAENIATMLGNIQIALGEDMKSYQQKLESIGKEKQEILLLYVRQVKDIIEQFKRISALSAATVNGVTKRMVQIDGRGLFELTETIIQEYLNLYIEQKIDQLQVVPEMELEKKAKEAFTPSNLFKAVVDVDNIRIKVLKVREGGYTDLVLWEELTVGNSGGEGYLSYFSVYLAILTYLREAKGLSSKTGKILLADNPFGKVTAPHLLSVVFDLLNRTNTQMIAFTGINDARIYRYFDRIFDVKLTPVIAGRERKAIIETLKEGSGDITLSMPDVARLSGYKSVYDKYETTNLFG